MPVTILNNDTLNVQPPPALFVEASHHWRVPVDLISAMIAVPGIDITQTTRNAQINDIARRLAIAWSRAPIIGNGVLEDGVGIYECWYFAIGRAGTGKDGPAANRYADKVLDILASGNHPLKSKIGITRLRPDQLTWGRNVFGAPAPWHFTGVERRVHGTPEIDIDLPLIQQVWDAPDGFDGSGSCGPGSFLMLLAGLGKIDESPLLVTNAYRHLSPYGGLLKEVDDRITEQHLGTVHFKMLHYIRDYFPTASMVYGDKVTKRRVMDELRAGRPVVLGTRVTSAGHLMVARGFTTDGRIIVNDPAGDQTRAARNEQPDGSYSSTGNRYWNGGGRAAQYDWEVLDVRWVLFIGPRVPDADEPEDIP